MPTNRIVSSKSITMGGKAPISVQTMLKNSFTSYSYDDLFILKCYGADILRFSIKGEYSGDELKKFISSSPISLVLDVKNIKKQAIDALKYGIDAIRINPSLLTKNDIIEIIKAASDNRAIIRIGTNDGSIKGSDPIEEIIKTIEIAESLSFNNLVLSIKSSSAERTYSLYSKLDSLTPYPLHIGLTESGDGIGGTVRSTIVLYELLKKGIGNTIRYSLAGSEKDEVRAGTELLATLGLKQNYLNLVICPSCDRATFNTGVFYKNVCDDIFKATYGLNKKITLAIMGCTLNGIGESKDADIGISGCLDKVLIFKKGNIVDKVDYNSLSDALKKQIESIA